MNISLLDKIATFSYCQKKKEQCTFQSDPAISIRIYLTNMCNDIYPRSRFFSGTQIDSFHFITSSHASACLFCAVTKHVYRLTNLQ